MEEIGHTGHVLKHPAFFIEAAIDERGPQKLRIVPSFGQYLVYDNDDNMLTCIQQTDDTDWEQIAGSLTEGAVQVVGKEIMRVKGL